MSVECFGTYNGLPVYTDPHMDKDKILTVNKNGGKPNPNHRVKDPRTKGLMHGQVKAFIMHPETADKLKQSIYNGTWEEWHLDGPALIGYRNGKIEIQ